MPFVYEITGWINEYRKRGSFRYTVFDRTKRAAAKKTWHQIYQLNTPHRTEDFQIKITLMDSGSCCAAHHDCQEPMRVRLAWFFRYLQLYLVSSSHSSQKYQLHNNAFNYTNTVLFPQALRVPRTRFKFSAQTFVAAHVLVVQATRDLW